MYRATSIARLVATEHAVAEPQSTVRVAMYCSAGVSCRVAPEDAVGKNWVALNDKYRTSAPACAVTVKCAVGQPHRVTIVATYRAARACRVSAEATVGGN